MEHMCASILQPLGTPAPDGPIRESNATMTDLISANVYRLFDAANQKLHIFLFKDARVCWFRLYTNTSIVMTVGKI
jgi:hypothetical protein